MENLMDILKQPHILIGGCTGSGKSVLLNRFICELMHDTSIQKRYILIDPKRVELSRYKHTKFCLGFASEVNESIRLLKCCIAFMEERYEKMEVEKLLKSNEFHLYIIIDELADLVDSNKKTVFALLKKIARLGRAANIHIIAATQSPSRRVIPADLTLNFTGLIALRCRSSIESRQIIGIAGAENLPQFGKMIYVCPERQRPTIISFDPVDESIINSIISFFNKEKA